jgi:hypothetical protein
MPFQVEIIDTAANVRAQLIGQAGNVPPSEQNWYSLMVTAVIAQLALPPYSNATAVRLSARGGFDGASTRVNVVLDWAGADGFKNPLQLY